MLFQGPGYYKPSIFGIRLGNVLEVVNTDKRLPSGSKFLAFNDVTLVPYEIKLIDQNMLSTQEVYNIILFEMCFLYLYIYFRKNGLMNIMLKFVILLVKNLSDNLACKHFIG